MDRAEIEPPARELAELLDVVGDARPDAAERERRPDDARKTQLFDRGQGLLNRTDVAAVGDVGANRPHRVAEKQPVFGNLDGLDRGANQLDAILRERAVLAERNRQVERGLPAHGRQHGVRLLALDDGSQDFGRQRLDVRAIRELRVRHDGRRVAVDQHDLEPLVAQGLARLRTGIVELARLPDDDRAGADDEDAFDICSFGHGEVVGSGL